MYLKDTITLSHGEVAGGNVRTQPCFLALSISPSFFHLNMDLVNLPVVLVLHCFVFIIAIVKSSQAYDQGRRQRGARAAAPLKLPPAPTCPPPPIQEQTYSKHNAEVPSLAAPLKGLDCRGCPPLPSKKIVVPPLPMIGVR